MHSIYSGTGFCYVTKNGNATGNESIAVGFMPSPYQKETGFGELLVERNAECVTLVHPWLMYDGIVSPAGILPPREFLPRLLSAPFLRRYKRWNGERLIIRLPHPLKPLWFETSETTEHYISKNVTHLFRIWNKNSPAPASTRSSFDGYPQEFELFHGSGRFLSVINHEETGDPKIIGEREEFAVPVGLALAWENSLDSPPEFSNGTIVFKPGSRVLFLRKRAGAQL